MVELPFPDTNLDVPGFIIEFEAFDVSADGSTIVGEFFAASFDDGPFLWTADNGTKILTQLDNRGSSYYLAMYWAQAVSEQTDNAELAERFAAVATALADNEAAIIDELNAAQGQGVDTGGYYNPDDELAGQAMRPSATLNAIIDSI